MTPFSYPSGRLSCGLTAIELLVELAQLVVKIEQTVRPFIQINWRAYVYDRERREKMRQGLLVLLVEIYCRGQLAYSPALVIRQIDAVAAAILKFDTEETVEHIFVKHYLELIDLAINQPDQLIQVSSQAKNTKGFPELVEWIGRIQLH